MDNQLLKRRLIGATVLVALGVIFIPMILSGGRDEMPLFGSNIPDKPRAIEQLKSLEVPRPDKIPAPANEAEVRLPVEEGIPAASIEPTKPQPETSKQEDKKDSLFSLPSFKKDTDKPKAWAVQVGSFNNRSNALALQNKLRKQEYAAFVEFVKNVDGGVYRVRVGPEVDHDKAVALATAIQKKTGIKGVVMGHP